MERTCPLCSNILSKIKQPPAEPWNEILHEAPSFVVTPTVGALVEGWILIISKRHVPAMGALPEEELYELNELVPRIKWIMQSIYGSVAIFEHGPACEGTTFGCGVDHAHFHVIPLQVALTPLIEEKLESPIIWENVTDIRDLSKIHLKKLSYLYILENDQSQGSIARLNNLPSQFTRRLIADFLGIPNLYDYRRYQFTQNVIETLRRLEVSHSSKPQCLAEVT